MNNKTSGTKMKWLRCLAGVALLAACCAVTTLAHAATCELQWKPLDGERTKVVDGQRVRTIESLFQEGRSQTFFIQIGGPKNARARSEEKDKPEFADVIKKELDKYQSEQPLRGVVKLGAEYYGFVLDTETPTPKKPEDAAENADKKDEAKSTEKKASLKASSGAARSNTSALRLRSVNGFHVLEEVGREGDGGGNSSVSLYTRLHFDRNHNGDLTDDEVVKAETTSGRTGGRYAAMTFPPMTVAIDAGGEKYDYAFRMSVRVSAFRGTAYAQGSVVAAGYREGQITLDGVEYRAVLVDFDANGRFDDTASIGGLRGARQAYIRLTPGDLLFLLKSDAELGFGGAHDPAMQESEHFVGKHINLAGRLFDMKVSPGGDKLTVSPAEGARGFLANATKDYQAVVYRDAVPLKISPDASGKSEVPPGDWKLYSYTIDRTEQYKTVVEKKEAEEKEQAAKKVAANAAEKKKEQESAKTAQKAAKPKPLAIPYRMPTNTVVYARADGDYKAVTASEGKTVEMPFGPPFKTIVTATCRSGAKTASLSLKLAGSGGESCSALMLGGKRPERPTFAIAESDGTVVDTGSFEYG